MVNFPPIPSSRGSSAEAVAGQGRPRTLGTVASIRVAGRQQKSSAGSVKGNGRQSATAAADKTTNGTFASTHKPLARVKDDVQLQRCITELEKTEREHDTKVDTLQQIRTKLEHAQMLLRQYEQQIEQYTTQIETLLAANSSSDPQHDDSKVTMQLMTVQGKLEVLMQQQQHQRTVVTHNESMVTLTERQIQQLAATANQQKLKLKRLKAERAERQQADKQQALVQQQQVDAQQQKVRKYIEDEQKTNDVMSEITNQLQALQSSPTEQSVDVSIQNKMDELQLQAADFQQQQDELQLKRLTSILELKDSTQRVHDEIAHQHQQQVHLRQRTEKQREAERRELEAKGLNADGIFAQRDELKRAEHTIKRVKQQQAQQSTTIRQRLQREAELEHAKRLAEAQHDHVMQQYQLQTHGNMVQQLIEKRDRQLQRQRQQPQSESQQQHPVDGDAQPTAIAQASEPTNAGALGIDAGVVDIDQHHEDVPSDDDLTVTQTTTLRSTLQAIRQQAQQSLHDQRQEIEKLRSPITSPRTQLSHTHAIHHNHSSAPAFITTPTITTFIDCHAQQTYTQLVTITNGSTSMNTFRLRPLHEYDANASQYVTVKLTLPGRMSPGTQCQLQIHFTPTHALVQQQEAGPLLLHTTLQFTTEHGAGFELPINCCLPQPSAAVHSPQLKLTDLPLLSTVKRSIELENTGGVDMQWRLNITPQHSDELARYTYPTEGTIIKYSSHTVPITVHALKAGSLSDNCVEVSFFTVTPPPPPVVEAIDMDMPADTNSDATDMSVYTEAMSEHDTAIDLLYPRPTTPRPTYNLVQSFTVPIVGSVSPLPVTLASSTLEYHTVLLNKLYRQALTLTNHSNLTQQVKLSVPPLVRKCVTITPRATYIQPNSESTIQITLKVNDELLEKLKSNTANSAPASSAFDNLVNELGTTALSVAADIQLVSHPLTPLLYNIAAQVTPSALLFRPASLKLTFPMQYLHTTAAQQVQIYNPSAVAQKLLIDALPADVAVMTMTRDTDNVHTASSPLHFTLLPQRTTTLYIQYKPSRVHAQPIKHTLTMRTSVGDTYKLSVKCESTVHAPLQLNARVLQLPATINQHNTSVASFVLTNTTIDDIVTAHMLVPELLNRFVTAAERSCCHEAGVEPAVSSYLTLSPSVVELRPQQSQRVEVLFQPQIPSRQAIAAIEPVPASSESLQRPASSSRKSPSHKAAAGKKKLSKKEQEALALQAAEDERREAERLAEQAKLDAQLQLQRQEEQAAANADAWVEEHLALNVHDKVSATECHWNTSAATLQAWSRHNRHQIVVHMQSTSSKKKATVLHAPLHVTIHTTTVLPTLQLSTSTVDLSNVNVNTTVTHSVKVTNLKQHVQTLTVGELPVNSKFSCSLQRATLQPDETTDLVVQYAPVQAVRSQELLQLYTTHDGITSPPHTLTLVGTAIEPQITSSHAPSNISFGDVLATTSVVRSLTLSHANNTTEQVQWSAELAGDDAQCFAVSPASSGKLSANEVAALQIRFTPAASGNATERWYRASLQVAGYTYTLRARCHGTPVFAVQQAGRLETVWPTRIIQPTTPSARQPSAGSKGKVKKEQSVSATQPTSQITFSVPATSSNHVIKSVLWIGNCQSNAVPDKPVKRESIIAGAGSAATAASAHGNRKNNAAATADATYDVAWHNNELADAIAIDPPSNTTLPAGSLQKVVISVDTTKLSGQAVSSLSQLQGTLILKHGPTVVNVIDLRWQVVEM